MFTIEMDWDETAITILDESGEYEDLQVLIYDDIVYIRQWFEEANRFSVVAITPEMFHALMVSMKLPEGAYKINKERG